MGLSQSTIILIFFELLWTQLENDAVALIHQFVKLSGSALSTYSIYKPLTVLNVTLCKSCKEPLSFYRVILMNMKNTFTKLI